ncbi:MAG: T9SS type A sorting domain-containing protein [Candidatus Cloacimonetes bacterium]|nr:T9SS type A sorting domain-containing protein [Candidatus Cloacimonadota bacterium]
MSKKLVLILVLVLAIASLYAKDYDINLQTNSNSVEMLRNDYNNLNLSFSFEGINHINVETKNGVFSELIISQAYSTGNLGEPKLPAIKKLIEIPYGAEVSVRVVNYDVNEFKLSDNGILNPLIPVQPSLRKDVDASTVKFEYNEKAYSANQFTRSKIAQVNVLGQMRGMRIARLEISPVEYNPVSGVIRVYNNIDIEIEFTGSDIAQTEYLKKSTASPYFKVVYDKILNSRDSYDDNPDLVTYPIKYLIVSDPMFETQLQPFIEWKIKKGFEVIVAYTDDIGSSYNSIRSWIHDQYNAGTPEDPAPSFFLLVGDTNQIPAIMGSSSGKMTDLYYASVDGDYFPEMYYGRFSANNVAQLQPQIDKTLYYEQYLFEDPSYLDNVTLIAGHDTTWNPRVGQATIQYGTENYFNSAHGFDEVHEYLTSYTGCYDTVNQGIGYINYTAHGSDTSWANPSLNQTTVNNFSNVNQPTIAVGNCCLTGNFGYNVSNNDGECFGETWLRADNAALGYIGSSPSSYWFEDFYWSVGAFPLVGNNNGYVPTYEETTWGAYDGAFVTDYVAMDATVFIGNLSVTEMDSQGFPQQVNGSAPLYYWQSYNLLGDPSILPYFTQGSVNDVSYLDILPLGTGSFDVTTEPGSYVAISFEGVLHGAALVGASGVVSVTIDPINDSGMADIVVTKSQYQPYIEQVLVAPLEGAYVTIDEVTISAGDDDVIEFGENVDISVTLKNVGTETASGTNMTLSIDDQYITLTDDSETIGTINADQTITFNNAFVFSVSNNVPNDYQFQFDVMISAGNNEWPNSIPLTAYAPVLSISGIAVSDDANNMLDPGDRADILVTVINEGGAKATNLLAILSSQSNFITFNDDSDEVASLEASTNATFTFDINVSEDAEVGDNAIFNFNISADNECEHSESFALSLGLVLEDFETGDFSQFPWEFEGDSNWEISTEAYQGDYAAVSGSISDAQVTTIYLQQNISNDIEFKFWKKVSSESGYDFFRFFLDGQELGIWSGDEDWSEESYDITAGDHEFKWEYSKDSSVSGGDDCAWLDNINFTGNVTPPAELVCNPNEFSLEMQPNTTQDRTLTLENIGGEELNYTISIQNTTEGRNLTGSYMECDAGDFTPGNSVTWTFSVYCESDDNEWIEDVWVQFPSGVVVNSSTDLVGGSGGDIPSENITGDGIEMHWGGDGYMADGQVATATVDVTIGAGFVGNISLPYVIHGDEWGDEPHEITGEMTLTSSGEPLTWLTLSSNSGSIGANNSEEIILTFDTNELENSTYTANLIITHNGRNEEIIPITLVVDPDADGNNDIISLKTNLGTNYPNPFNPETTIKYNLKTDANVELEIYNIKGQKVKTLVNNEMKAGAHTIVWQGKDENNNSVSSGVYFYKLNTKNCRENFTATRKMILMK